MSERIVIINPAKKAEYLDMVEERFRDWHEEGWNLAYSYDVFRQEITNSSFLAMVGRIVDSIDSEGKVDMGGLEKKLRKSMDENFSETRFRKAERFVREGRWEDL